MALVITIIILLILAGISIATLTGSGLFEKARLAEQESKNKQEEEQGILGDYENKIESYLSNTRNNNLTKYTTEEQVIGTWIDGEPIYQKTYFVENDNSPNDCLIDSNFSLSKYKLINAWGVCNDATGNNIIIPYGNAWGAEWSIGIVQQKEGDSLNLVERSTYSNIYITVQYIKLN